DWMLDLQAGVHLEEVEAPVPVDEELDRPSVGVADGLRDLDGGDAEPTPQLVVDRRRGRLLDQLLMPPLDRAVALAQPDHLATRRAAVFSPRSRCTVAGGPMKTRSAAATAWAKSAFSARKP